MTVPSSATTGPEAIYANIFAGTPYRVIRRLGAGGMGEVFLVEHAGIGRELVAKLLHERYAADPRLLQRLRIEAQALGQLDHAHIVSIVGFDGTRDGRSFIVMEHLSGRSLAEELRERERLPVLEAVAYTCELLSALSAAHSKGIVHRDVKPDNLFICERLDGSRYLKVLDFGVARVMPGSSSVRPMPADLRTDTGVVVGTPRYLSPEGALGQHVDARADVYATSLVLYLMLVGRGPFDHIQSDALLLSAHAVEDPEPPSRFAREPVPPELDQAVLRALAKNRDARFQSADEFRALLLHVADLLKRAPAEPQTAASHVDSLADRGHAPGVQPAAGLVRAVASGGAQKTTPTPLPPAEPSLAGSGQANLAPRTLVLLFFLAVVVAGALAAALVAFSRGAGS